MKMSSKKFKVGDTVLAKGEKKATYFPAEVSKVAGDSYVLTFNSGDVQTVPARNVIDSNLRRGRSVSKSPSRELKKSPGRPLKSDSPKKRSSSASRGRSTKKETPKKSTKKGSDSSPEKSKKEGKKKSAPRSRSSSTARSKSADARKKEPTKKQTKAKTESAKKQTKAKVKKVSPSPDPEIEIDQKLIQNKIDVLDSPPPPPIDMSATESESEEDKFVVSAATKVIEKDVVTEKRGFVVEQMTVHKRSSARLAAKSMVTREATPIFDRAVPDFRPVTTKADIYHGGTIGVVFQTILSLLLTFGINLACQKLSCSITEKPRFPNNWIVFFFTPEYVGAFFVFLTLQALFLTLVPIGKMITLGSSSFRNNGVLSVLLTASGIAGLIYWKVPILTKEKDVFTLMAVSYLSSLFLSIVLYIRGKKATSDTINPLGNSGKCLYDWFVGRELNPMIGPLNVKVLVMRTGLLGMALFDGCILWKSYKSAEGLSPTLAVAAGCQLLYVFCEILKEKHLNSSPYGRLYGVGFQFLCMYLCSIPFLAGLSIRYLRTFKVEATRELLASAVAVFLCGLILTLTSQALKKKFARKSFVNRNQPMLVRIRGYVKSGIYGFFRNASYFGDLLVFTGITLPCGFQAAIPWVQVGLAAVATAYRQRMEKSRSF